MGARKGEGAIDDMGHAAVAGCVDGIFMYLRALPQKGHSSAFVSIDALGQYSCPNSIRPRPFTYSASKLMRMTWI